VVVRHALERAQQGCDGRFGLLRVAAELIRQVAFDAFAQGQELGQRGVVALVELAQVQGGVTGTLDLISGAVQIQNERAWHDADQDQHDQANAFLAIVGTVHKADRHGRDHQNQSVPERRVLLVIQLAALLGGLVHLGPRAPPLQADQHQARNHETGDWREHQRGTDIDSLLPVHPVTDRDAADQGIGQAHAQDRTDQGVRA